MDPIALVVGGSRGLGLLIARELAARGHTPVLVARDDAELQRARQGLPAATRTYVADVRDADQVAAMVRSVEDEVGPVGSVFTVAGVIQVGPAEAMTLEHYREAVDTMLWGPVHVALEVAPLMRRRGHGRIGTVTSVGGMVSPPHLLPYATAKFGAVGFSDGLVAALAGTGVTATTVVPGLMRTGSHQRAKVTGDVAKEYAWFAPAASLPVLSIDAERAAKRIVDGVLAGKPIVVLTPLAWAAIRVRGLVPGTTNRAMGVVNRLLPRGDSSRTVEGRQARRELGSRLVDRLTTLGDRAARRTNEGEQASS